MTQIAIGTTKHTLLKYLTLCLCIFIDNGHMGKISCIDR